MEKIKFDFSSQLKLDRHVPSRYYSPDNDIELAAITRYERIATTVSETSAEGAARAATHVARLIERCVRDHGRCVIGFGAGKCALKVYDELVKLYFADKVSFAQVIAFNIGELGLGSDDTGDGSSTFDRLNRHLFNNVDIPRENIHTINKWSAGENIHAVCRAYESTIADYGGLDLVVCQLTKNATVAYNEAGSAMNSTCRLVLLSDDSRNRVAEAFQRETAPKTAVTLGIANILAARHIVAVAWGEDSAAAVQGSIEGRMGENMPASFLQMHHNARLFVDLEAASRLTRIQYPWRVTSCDWNDRLIRRAIVWMCKQTGKPILKLTNRDYTDFGLGDLLAEYGSAHVVNIKVFNGLQQTITGWPGGKPDTDDTLRPERAKPYPKRVLAFGPHPDDVIVSMGGTINRLTEQGHEVHVVFQTSGDVAVTDDNLRRSVMIFDEVARHYGKTMVDSQRLRADLRTFLEQKNSGAPDNADARFIKGAILSVEGLMSCRRMGVRDEHVHRLTLPFYTDDPFGCGRVTEADAAVVRQLIEQVKPHQIYIATDADPYGTHVRATNAVLMAIDQLAHEPFMRDCRVWMYRGQWGQWDIDQIEMAVPMSPDQFRLKRDAILLCTSQVHDAPIRDNADGQLSWQRSLERNSTLADYYNSLGLAAYEAIEAFVQYTREIPDNGDTQCSTGY